MTRKLTRVSTNVEILRSGSVANEQPWLVLGMYRLQALTAQETDGVILAMFHEGTWRSGR